MNAFPFHPSMAARRQVGMTLVELMVAIIVALFMAAALLMVFMGMNTNYGTQARMTLLQDSQRVVMTILNRAVEEAGYFVDPVHQNASDALPAGVLNWPDGSNSPWSAGQFVLGTGDAADSGTGNPDRMALRFQTASNDGLYNCNGGTNTSGGPLVYTDVFFINDQSQLSCSVNGAAPVVLADGIARMQILYGTDTLGKGQVDAYLPASLVTSTGMWNNVRSVKLRVFFLDPSVSPPATLPNPMLQLTSMHNKS
jgi:type IV pilus assembly protein PilW